MDLIKCSDRRRALLQFGFFGLHRRRRRRRSPENAWKTYRLFCRFENCYYYHLYSLLIYIFWFRLRFGIKVQEINTNSIYTPRIEREFVVF